MDILNPIVYKKASGIIAQTTEAQMICQKATNHKNIKVISNPIRTLDLKPLKKEKIILNVGRFIKSKKQEWLIDYFDQISNGDWSLIFLGDGPELKRIKKYAEEKANAKNIHFLGTSKNVDFYYNIASIFAFTSVSEGFPNVLGEAMAAGLACISFDCSAGPSEIIDHEKNGLLIAESDHKEYTKYLKLLMESKSLRQKYGNAAKAKSKQFDTEIIAKQYLGFILKK